MTIEELIEELKKFANELGPDTEVYVALNEELVGFGDLVHGKNCDRWWSTRQDDEEDILVIDCGDYIFG